MCSFAHTHEISLGTKSEFEANTETGHLGTPILPENSPCVAEVPTPTSIHDAFFDEFDSIADKIATLDAERGQAEVRCTEGLHQQGARLYGKALALRSDDELWSGLVARRFWEGRSGWKPKPEDQQNRALHFAFMLGYRARDEPERKRASKHAKALEPLFNMGASEAEALQFLRSTGGFKGEKRKASSPSHKVQKAKSAFNAAAAEIKNKHHEPSDTNDYRFDTDAVRSALGLDSLDFALCILQVEIRDEFVAKINALRPNQHVVIRALYSEVEGRRRLVATSVAVSTIHEPAGS